MSFRIGGSGDLLPSDVQSIINANTGWAQYSGSQLATVGNINATLINYTEAVWEEV